MEFIYSIDLNSYISDEELKVTDNCMSCLSNQNILAVSNDCFVYILPLEKPNELIPVTLNNNPCVYLCWSDDSQYLLTAFKNGVCNLFSIKTSLLNSIELVYSFQIDNKNIATIKPFRKSPKLCFNAEKNDSNSFLDRYSYKSFNVIKNSAKFCNDGFLILTKSGKIHVVLTDFNSVKNKFEKFDYDMSLVNYFPQEHSHESNEEGELVTFDFFDFSFESDGSLNVIFTNKHPSTPIYIYKVNLKLSSDCVSINGTNDQLATLSLAFDTSVYSKSKLVFTTNESAQQFCLVLKLNHTNCDLIQIWQPSQLNTNLIGSFDEACKLISSISCPSSLINLTVSKCALSFKNFNDNKYTNDFLYLIASYQNGTVGFIDLQTYSHSVTSAITTSFDSSFPFNEESTFNNKKQRFTQEYILAMDQSLTSSICIGLTNFCRLIAIRQYATLRDNPNAQSSYSNFLPNLYEYYLMTGYDYWDLLMNTSPKLVDNLIERLEDKYRNQMTPSLQQVYFSSFYSLIYSLTKRGSSYSNQAKSYEYLSKLMLNRALSLITYSVQLVLNVELLSSSLSSTNVANLVNKNLINTSLVTSHADSIDQSNQLNQVAFKQNLSEYFSNLLKLKLVDANNKYDFKLNEFIQSILNRKNYQVCVNQQLKHIFQWILDLALQLASQVAQQTQNKSNQFGSGLLNDLVFLNELRKSVLYMKLIIILNQQQNPFIAQSVPILSVRIMQSNQRDLLSDLFQIFSKIVFKSADESVDESVLDLCSAIQFETVIRPVDELFFNLKHTWLGNPTSTWQECVKLPVDHLFQEEKSKKLYPLFDVIRMIQFSRSSVTKQCIRCGNYTESNSSSSIANSRSNCIYIQDSCAEKCICGGSWVLSSIN